MEDSGAFRMCVQLDRDTAVDVIVNLEDIEGSATAGVGKWRTVKGFLRLCSVDSTSVLARGYQ